MQIQHYEIVAKNEKYWRSRSESPNVILICIRWWFDIFTIWLHVSVSRRNRDVHLIDFFEKNICLIVFLWNTTRENPWRILNHIIDLSKTMILTCMLTQRDDFSMYFDLTSWCFDDDTWVMTNNDREKDENFSEKNILFSWLSQLLSRSVTVKMCRVTTSISTLLMQIIFCDFCAIIVGWTICIEICFSEWISKMQIVLARQTRE